MKITKVLEQQTMSKKFVEKFAQYIQGLSDDQLDEITDLWDRTKVGSERKTMGPRRTKIASPT